MNVSDIHISFVMSSRLRKSFTLIEMLIVIVIIGILAAALIPRLQSVQSRARDSQRKIDSRTIINAAEIGYVDLGRYPWAGMIWHMPENFIAGGQFYSFSGTPYRLPEMTWILTSFPLDPLNTCNGSGNATCRSRYGDTHQYCACHPTMWGYTYAYEGLFLTSKSFNMTMLLENNKDPDRCETTLNVINSAGNTCIVFSGQTGYPHAVEDGARKRFYIQWRRQ